MQRRQLGGGAHAPAGPPPPAPCRRHASLRPARPSPAPSAGRAQLNFGDVLGSGELNLKEEVRAFLRQRLAQSTALAPAQILLRDKVTFTLGSLDLFVSAYWLGFRWAAGRCGRGGVPPGSVMLATRERRWHAAEVAMARAFWAGPCNIMLLLAPKASRQPRPSSPLHSPQTFYKLYTVKAVLLLACRWVVYRLKRW